MGTSLVRALEQNVAPDLPVRHVREEHIIAAVESVERYALRSSAEPAGSIELYAWSCMLTRFAAAHTDRFSTSVRQRLSLMHGRLSHLSITVLDLKASGANAQTRLVAGLWQELAAMVLAEDSRDELGGWELIWIRPACVPIEEVNSWLGEAPNLPSIEELGASGEPDLSPLPKIKKAELGLLEKQVLNSLVEVVKALVGEIDWLGPKGPKNPLFEKLAEIVATLGEPLLLILGEELFRSGGSLSFTTKQLSMPAATIGSAPYRVPAEKELLAFQLTDFMTHFTSDYILALPTWKVSASTKALGDMLPLGFEFVVRRFLMPILENRPRSLTREWHEYMLVLLDALSSFLEDYHQARTDLMALDPMFEDQMLENQEVAIIGAFVKLARARQEVLPCASTKSKASLHRRQCRAVKAVLKPYLELAKPSMPPSIEQLLEEYPNVMDELIATVINTVASPQFTGLVMERSLDYLLPTLMDALETDSGGSSGGTESSADFGDMEKMLGVQIRRLTDVGMKLGGASGWLKGAYLIGKSFITHFESLIGKGVHRAIDSLISKDTLHRMVETASKLYWRSDEEGMEPVFTGCFELSEEDTLALRIRLEQKCEGVLHKIMCGAASQSTASLKLVKTSAVKRTCDNVSGHVFDLIWQPAVLKVFIYDYLFPRAATLKPMVGRSGVGGS